MKNEDQDYRFERKFIFQNSFYDSLNNFKYLLPYDLKELYKPRIINSIYFDTENLNLARQNIEGFKNRFKVRIRYYGDNLRLNEPVLEIKLKQGQVGKKFRFSLEKKDLITNNFQITNLINTEKLPIIVSDTLLQVKPILSIKYLRNYYSAVNQKYRLTFDKNISFKFLSNTNIMESIERNAEFNYFSQILEIKYSNLIELNSSLISRRLPVRLSNFSKYIIALNTLGMNIV